MTGNRPITIFGKVPEYEEAQKEFVRRMTQSDDPKECCIWMLAQVS